MCPCISAMASTPVEPWFVSTPFPSRVSSRRLNVQSLQPFHSDMGCDILALQVRHSARAGGQTYLASAATVFNHILREEPGVAKTLMSPNWPVQM